MRQFSIVILALCATLVTPVLLGAQVGPPILSQATVTVDCDANETLAAALATRALSLTVEFTGTCAEELVISRDRLTIRGLDASATVTDDPATTDLSPSFLLQGADVVFQSFTIEGSAGRGIRIQRSSGVRLEDMTVRNNGNAGLTVEESSSAHVVDSSFTGNDFAGIAAWGNSNVTLTGSLDVSGNEIVGLLLSNGSAFRSLEGSSIVSNDQIFGVATQFGATGLFALTQADNNGIGAITFGGTLAGQMNITGGNVGIVVTDRGHFDAVADVSVFGVALLASEDSTVFLRLGSTLQAAIALDFFNSVLKANLTTFDGDVELRFNTQANFVGITTTGAVACDPTVVVLGSSICSSPLTGGAAEFRGPGGRFSLPYPMPLTQPE
jgi:hypothetical protein